MNRRQFFSMMAGAAGAALVPWRGSIEPVIILPSRSHLSLAELMETTWRKYGPRVVDNIIAQNPLFSRYSGYETINIEAGSILEATDWTWREVRMVVQ